MSFEGGQRRGCVSQGGRGAWGVSVTSLVLHPHPRNLENVEAARGQVLVPRVLALLTGLMAKVRGLPG